MALLPIDFNTNVTARIPNFVVNSAFTNINGIDAIEIYGDEAIRGFFYEDVSPVLVWNRAYSDRVTNSSENDLASFNQHKFVVVYIAWKICIAANEVIGSMSLSSSEDNAGVKKTKADVVEVEFFAKGTNITAQTAAHLAKLCQSLEKELMALGNVLSLDLSSLGLSIKKKNYPPAFIVNSEPTE